MCRYPRLFEGLADRRVGERPACRAGVMAESEGTAIGCAARDSDREVRSFLPRHRVMTQHTGLGGGKQHDARKGQC